MFDKVTCPSRELGKPPTRGYKEKESRKNTKNKEAHNSKLSYKHRLNVYEYELYKIPTCDSVLRRQ